MPKRTAQSPPFLGPYGPEAEPGLVTTDETGQRHWTVSVPGASTSRSHYATGPIVFCGYLSVDSRAPWIRVVALERPEVYDTLQMIAAVEQHPSYQLRARIKQIDLNRCVPDAQQEEALYAIETGDVYVLDEEGEWGDPAR